MPKPSVTIKFSWVLGVVFVLMSLSYQVCLRRILFAARARSPCLASALLPSYYYLTQYFEVPYFSMLLSTESFNRIVPSVFAYLVFYVVFLC